MTAFLVVCTASFLAMEAVSYLVHRFVYHGFLWMIHRSHHTKRKGPFEMNDVFPVVFAALTILLMWFGFSSPGGGTLLPVTSGMTLYGCVYFFIHDLYVHRRIKSIHFRLPFLLALKKAHAVHHRHGGEPYGLLFFVSPKRLLAEIVTEDEQV